jgi:hypothetical protein
MNKERLIELRDEAEAKCNSLYGQIETIRAQGSQMEVELERSRGDFRTLTTLVDEFPDKTGEDKPADSAPEPPADGGTAADIPEEDKHLDDKKSKKEKTSV